MPVCKCVSMLTNYRPSAKYAILPYSVWQHSTMLLLLILSVLLLCTPCIVHINNTRHTNAFSFIRSAVSTSSFFPILLLLVLQAAWCQCWPRCIRAHTATACLLYASAFVNIAFSHTCPKSNNARTHTHTNSTQRWIGLDISCRPCKCPWFHVFVCALVLVACGLCRCGRGRLRISIDMYMCDLCSVHCQSSI